MRAGLLAHALRLYLPLLVLGASAGVVQALGRRSPRPGRRRLAFIAWVLMLLVGAPLYLVLAAALGWI